MDNEKVRDIINATGALAEMLGAFRESLQDNGFTDHECVYLCGKLLQAIIFNGKAEE